MSPSSPRACRVCGSKSNLYLTGCCRKMVICLECGKSMVLKKELCADCGMLFERVVREYDVRFASSSENKKYILAEYEDETRASDFSKNDKWALQKADPLAFYDVREAIPVFSNLLRLSLTVDAGYYHWKLLPILPEKSPNLHTLVIKGPPYVDNIEREYGLSCPVKVLKITQYGGHVRELEQMKLFLKKLPCIGLVKVRAYATNDKKKARITKDLLKVFRWSSCSIHIKFREKTN